MKPLSPPTSEPPHPPAWISHRVGDFAVIMIEPAGHQGHHYDLCCLNVNQNNNAY